MEKQDILSYSALLFCVSVGIALYFRKISGNQTRLWPLAWRIGGAMFLAGCCYFLTGPMNILGYPPPGWLYFLPPFLWLSLPFIYRPLKQFLDLSYQQGILMLLFSVCLSLHALLGVGFFLLFFTQSPLPLTHREAPMLPVVLPFLALAFFSARFGAKNLWNERDAFSLLAPISGFCICGLLFFIPQSWFLNTVTFCITALGFTDTAEIFTNFVLPLGPLLLALITSPFLFIARRNRPNLSLSNFLLTVFFGITLGYCSVLIILALMYASYS